MHVTFYIGSIKANGIESSSALNIGTNLLIGFMSNSKSISGNGSVTGDYGSMPAYSNYVDDADWLDSPMWTQPSEPAGWW